MIGDEKQSYIQNEIMLALDAHMGKQFRVCSTCGRRKRHKHFWGKGTVCMKCRWRNSHSTITLEGMIAVDEGIRIAL